MRIRSLFLFTLLLIADACVDPLKVPDIALEEGIVVDGTITDQPGPHSVKIFSAMSLDQDLDRRESVRGAAVSIRDDQGHVTVLKEEADGIYYTDGAFRGEIGRTYQLFITLENGRQYESSAVLLEPAGEISRVFFEFQENVINQNDISRPQDAFAVYVDAKGTPGASNLFRWRWTGTFHFRTFPELRTKWVGMVEIPDPLPCSGYIYDGNLIQVDICECCDCWKEQYNTDALVSENAYVDAIQFNAVRLAQVPVDKRLFYDKYHLEIEQLSVPKDVYAFWKLVKAQQQGATDIFQPAVVKIQGTIRCTSDPSRLAYGIFTASAVTKKTIVMTRGDIPKAVAPIDTVRDDCRLLYNGSSNQRPPFW